MFIPPRLTPPFLPRQVRKHVRTIAAAVAYMHACNAVHQLEQKAAHPA